MTVCASTATNLGMFLLSMELAPHLSLLLKSSTNPCPATTSLIAPSLALVEEAAAADVRATTAAKKVTCPANVTSLVL